MPYPDCDFPAEVTTLPPGEGSICEKIANNPSLEPICQPCETGAVFLMVSSQDNCIKEYRDDVMYRQIVESVTVTTAWTETDHPVGVATYIQDPYASLVQTDARMYGSGSNKTALRSMVSGDSLDFDDEERAFLHCHVGVGSQPKHLMWHTSEPRPVDELSGFIDSEHVDNDTRHDRLATFPFFRVGHCLAWRLMIATETGEPTVYGETSLNEMFALIHGSHGDYI